MMGPPLVAYTSYYTPIIFVKVCMPLNNIKIFSSYLRKRITFPLQTLTGLVEEFPLTVDTTRNIQTQSVVRMQRFGVLRQVIHIEPLVFKGLSSTDLVFK